MIRLPLLPTLLLIFWASSAGGCHRSMNPAVAPYGANGAMAPAGSQPLIPFGPLQGATRVPPPATGSSQASLGYQGPTTAMASPIGSGFVASTAAPHDSFAGQSITNQSNGSPARTSMGGMPVIDLTAGLADRRPPANASQQQQAGPMQTGPIQVGTMQQPGAGMSSQPVVASAATPGGSFAQPQQPAGGVAMAGWQTPESISVPQGDLAGRLRPLDAAAVTTMVPLHGQGGFQGNATGQGDWDGGQGSQQPAWNQPAPHSQMPASQVVSSQEPRSQVAMTQYRGHAEPAAGAALEPVAGQASDRGQFPSTDPVEGPTVRVGQSESLLWRNPSVAR